MPESAYIAILPEPLIFSPAHRLPNQTLRHITAWTQPNDCCHLMNLWQRYVFYFKFATYWYGTYWYGTWTPLIILVSSYKRQLNRKWTPMNAEKTMLFQKTRPPFWFAPKPDKPEPKALTTEDTEDTEESLRRTIRINLPPKTVFLRDPLCPLW